MLIESCTFLMLIVERTDVQLPRMFLNFFYFYSVSFKLTLNSSQNVFYSKITNQEVVNSWSSEYIIYSSDIYTFWFIFKFNLNFHLETAFPRLACFPQLLNAAQENKFCRFDRLPFAAALSGLQDRLFGSDCSIFLDHFCVNIKNENHIVDESVIVHGGRVTVKPREQAIYRPVYSKFSW